MKLMTQQQPPYQLVNKVNQVCPFNFDLKYLLITKFFPPRTIKNLNQNNLFIFKKKRENIKIYYFLKKEKGKQ